MNDLPENFKDHPPTVAELRSYKDNDASKWRLRDALLMLLREIDNGEWNSDKTYGVIVICEHVDDKNTRIQTYFASRDHHDAIAMMAIGNKRLLEDD